MNISLLRTLLVALAMLFSASLAHAEFEGFIGTKESYPHDPLALVSPFKPGRYLVTYTDGRTSNVIITRKKDGTYHVKGAQGSATFGFYEAAGGYETAFGYDDGSPGNYRYIVVRAQKGVIVAYDTSVAARLYLRRRVPVRVMPYPSAATNRKFLEGLTTYSSTFKILYTAIPIK